MTPLGKVLINILLLLEAIALIASVIYLKYLRRKGLGLLMVFLSSIVITEVVGKLMLLKVITGIQNSFWFNIMLPLQFILILLLFHKKFSSIYWKWLVKMFIALIFVLGVVQLVSDPNITNKVHYGIGVAFISFACIRYLFEITNKRNIEDTVRNPMLYFTLGTLFFYLGTLPLRTTGMYLYKNYTNIFWGYYYLQFALNYLMYGLISFGIIWSAKK